MNELDIGELDELYMERRIVDKILFYIKQRIAFFSLLFVLN